MKTVCTLLKACKFFVEGPAKTRSIWLADPTLEIGQELTHTEFAPQFCGDDLFCAVIDTLRLRIEVDGKSAIVQHLVGIEHLFGHFAEGNPQNRGGQAFLLIPLVFLG